MQTSIKFNRIDSDIPTPEYMVLFVITREDLKTNVYSKKVISLRYPYNSGLNLSTLALPESDFKFILINKKNTSLNMLATWFN